MPQQLVQAINATWYEGALVALLRSRNPQPSTASNTHDDLFADTKSRLHAERVKLVADHVALGAQCAKASHEKACCLHREVVEDAGRARIKEGDKKRRRDSETARQRGEETKRRRQE